MLVFPKKKILLTILKSTSSQNPKSPLLSYQSWQDFFQKEKNSYFSFQRSVDKLSLENSFFFVVQFSSSFSIQHSGFVISPNCPKTKTLSTRNNVECCFEDFENIPSYRRCKDN